MEWTMGPTVAASFRAGMHTEMRRSPLASARARRVDLGVRGTAHRPPAGSGRHRHGAIIAHPELGAAEAGGLRTGRGRPGRIDGGVRSSTKIDAIIQSG